MRGCSGSTGSGACSRDAHREAKAANRLMYLEPEATGNWDPGAVAQAGDRNPGQDW